MHRNPAAIRGDLKTKNILLSKDGIAKIADLGSSVMEGDKQLIFCTPPYAAPEVSCDMQCTRKVDIFAHGRAPLLGCSDTVGNKGRTIQQSE